MPGPYTNIFGPREAADVKAVTTRPTFTPTETNTDYWFKDCDPGDPESGTKWEAGFANFIVANFRRAVRGLGVAQDAADDDLLFKCFQKLQVPPSISYANIFGECYLKKDGSNLRLIRDKGFRILFPNAEAVPLPVAGATLAPTGLTPATHYFIYGYKSSTEVALEASATAPTVDAGSGIKIKTGDASRVLVGAAYIDTGPAFADTDGKLWVLSYFNRRPKLSVTRTVTQTSKLVSGSFSEFVSTLRNNYLTWADETVFARHDFIGRLTAGTLIGIGWDTTTAPVDLASAATVPSIEEFPAWHYVGHTESHRNPGAIAEGANHYATICVRPSEIAYIGTGVSGGPEAALRIQVNG